MSDASAPYPANAADVIAERLYAAGVRHAFGIPGGEVLTLIDALVRAGIGFHVARHENAAGFMAEGTYHATGAPGVLVATIGPGIANAVNVIANAEQDRVPLIVLSGKVADAEALSFTHQVFDHRALLGPICKATFEARSGACDVMIDKAIAVATDPRPGPVHIDLPIPVAAGAHARPDRATLRGTTVAGSPPAGAELESARAAFAAAKRPMIVAGLDVIAQPAAARAIRALSTTHAIPVVTTYKAKGVLPEDDPLCLGGHGLSQRSDGIILPLLARSDLIIAAGYDPIEMRAGWVEPWDPDRVIAFSATRNTHYVHHAAQEFIGDIAAGLEALSGGLAPAEQWPATEIEDQNVLLQDAFAAGDTWGPAQALHALNAAKPDDAIVTVDSGAHRILMSQLWTCAAPGRLLQSTGLCTMGCALPLATGRALAEPGRRTIAVMGDGCLDMVQGELATLRDLDLPVTVVVLVDGAYALIDLKQRAMGYQEAGVTFGRTDYAAVAEAVGLRAFRAANAEDVTAAMKASLDHNGPSVIAISIPDRPYDGLI